jgi:hypothetical protein
MNNLTTQELFAQLQDRLILDLKENEIACPKCKGLRMFYVQNRDEGHIDTCRNCHTGKLYVCKHCGKANDTDCCDCNEAYEERSKKWELEQKQKDDKNFQKAEKINYKDYDGYYFTEGDEHLKDQDDLEIWIEEKVMDGEEVPEYLWAVEENYRVSIDLHEVISEKCEDGYEDMYSCLDTEDILLSQAQNLINQWEKQQGNSLCVYSETHDKAVIIKDLVDKIREKILRKEDEDAR